MWIENRVFEEDLQYINNAEFIDWDKINNKTVFITGATGLIGYTLVCALLYRNLVYSSNIKVIALVRDIVKAKNKYDKQLKQNANIEFVVGDVERPFSINHKIDFIIHGANPTASRYFIEYPVETIKSVVFGTINILELARTHKIESMLYLSSMEIYGAPHTSSSILETHGTTTDTMSVRSCYPEAKRLCENLCISYLSEHKVPAKVIRLAQTFGPGISENDSRVFAEFISCVKNKQDIVLKTSGKSKRCYLYTADAVTAILAVLINGKNGEAYNAANTSTYCSILDMARTIVHEIANDEITMIFDKNDNGENANLFSPEHNLNLNVQKLEALKWRSNIDLVDMYKRVLL